MVHGGYSHSGIEYERRGVHIGLEGSDIKVSGHSLLPYLNRIWLVSGVLDKTISP